MTDANPLHLNDLTGDANALARHYSKFRVADRLLLTGHSHQAWPDCGFDGQQQAWLDAAERVDGKWELAFEKADRVRRGWSEVLEDTSGHVTLGSNTHELVVRLISALPLRARPRIVTTDGEFHTLRRQLDRLHEEGVEVVKVAAHPVDDLSARLAAAVNERTALVAVSSVLFQSALIVPGLGDVARACAEHGAELLVDAYHALGVLPFSIQSQGLETAFVVGGGYKYRQLGEGNCFLRAPAQCALRPVVTGWFAEFGALTEKATERVGYADGPARFDGATYDPTAHYRAAEVLDFFAAQRLTPTLLRRINQHQVGLLRDRFDALAADPAVVRRAHDEPLERVAGFLALETPHAAALHAALRERRVATDFRDRILRFGPAPYLSDRQLTDAIAALGEAVRTLAPEGEPR